MIETLDRVDVNKLLTSFVIIGLVISYAPVIRMAFNNHSRIAEVIKEPDVDKATEAIEESVDDLAEYAEDEANKLIEQAERTANWISLLADIFLGIFNFLGPTLFGILIIIIAVLSNRR